MHWLEQMFYCIWQICVAACLQHIREEFCMRVYFIWMRLTNQSCDQPHSQILWFPKRLACPHFHKKTKQNMDSTDKSHKGSAVATRTGARAPFLCSFSFSLSLRLSLMTLAAKNGELAVHFYMPCHVRANDASCADTQFAQYVRDTMLGSCFPSLH